MPNKTVLLTGITGYIAKHIAVQLLNADYNVRGSLRNLDRADEVMDAVRPHVDFTENLDERLTFVALDLADDDGWDAAMDGVDILMHTASPFPMTQPKNEDDTICPAVDGALRALRAAQAAGIKRVVMTSSCVAIMECDLPDGINEYTEANWSDLTRPNITPYSKSKTMAEQAAWKFVADKAPDMQLTTINPGLVTGAPLDMKFGTSVSLVSRLLKGADPMMPKFGIVLVDVGDVAAMHVAALDKPESVGHRFAAVAENMWFVDVAKYLKSQFPDRKIATRLAPNFMLHILAIFDKPLRSILPSLGKNPQVSNARAQDVLGITFMPAKKSLLETAEFLIKHDAL